MTAIGTLTDGELLIPRRAGSPLILCGDTKQLPPKVFSQDRKGKSGRRLNPMADHLMLTLMQRLENLGWPILYLTEQLRMTNGSFDLANYLIYNDKVIDGPCSALSYRQVATRFET
jgi:hypothetical protein